MVCSGCGPSTRIGSVHDPELRKEINKYGSSRAIIIYRTADRSRHQIESVSYLVKEDSTSWWQSDRDELTTIPSSDLIRITHTSYMSIYTGLLAGASTGVAGGTTIALINSRSRDTPPIIASSIFYGALLGMIIGYFCHYDWWFAFQ